MNSAALLRGKGRLKGWKRPDLPSIRQVLWCSWDLWGSCWRNASVQDTSPKGVGVNTVITARRRKGSKDAIKPRR
jgi:hypothetical protein